MSINRVVISGNLTRDPELRSTPSGLTILSMGVAVNDRRRNQQTNEWEDYANFIDCVVFGNRAEFLSRTLRKGSKVAIEGKLRYSSWENKEGQKRSKIEVIADNVEFFSARQQSGDYYQGGFDNQAAPSFSAPQPMPSVPAPSSTVAAPPKQEDVYDEDIPF